MNFSILVFKYILSTKIQYQSNRFLTNTLYMSEQATLMTHEEINIILKNNTLIRLSQKDIWTACRQAEVLLHLASSAWREWRCMSLLNLALVAQNQEKHNDK